MVILGRRHLEHVLAEYVAHYNEHRPHRALDQQAPLRVGTRPVPIGNPDLTYYEEPTSLVDSFASTNWLREALG